MKQFISETYDEERPLYGLNDIEVISCKFDGPADGESALKECENIKVKDCLFNLRYPFWHVNNGEINNCELTEKCRAALWYDNFIGIHNSKLHGIKALRECKSIQIDNCDIVSNEVFWKCNDIEINDTAIQSEYPFFESSNISITNLDMKAKYSFQYVKDMIIKSSKLDTKDAFWHSKNVTVYDSVIKGEYLGWYSENLKLVNCNIIGTQPLCYCKNLVLENCTMDSTDLAFERSAVNATINGKIDSIKNPLSGIIIADEIETIILEDNIVDPQKTIIKTKK